ncbi:MAG: FecR domain-containing protein, partial [Gallionella sp.]|nr:FecR domain-containing protein [Gallionella sp.]
MKNINKLLACLSVTIACLAGMSQVAHAAVAGHVQFVNGDVQVTNSAGQTRPAKKGDAISEGDTLTSAPSSSAQVKMRDGGFVAVRADTKMKFDQFAFDGKQDGGEKSFFSLFKGGFRAVTGLIGQANKQNYKITTPAATIGIRGTDHETFLIVPGSPLAQIAPTGAYNKVNVGETTLTTDKGTINVLPNQMGFAGGMNQAPQVQPINTKVFTVAEAAKPEAKAEKKEEKKEEQAEAKQEQKTASSDKEEKKEDKKEGGKDEAKEGSKDSKQADKGSGEAKGDTKEAKQEGTAAETKQASTEKAASPSSGQTSDTTAATGGSQEAAAGGATSTAPSPTANTTGGATDGGSTGGAAQGATTAAAPAPAPAPTIVMASQEPAPMRVSAGVDTVPPNAGLIQTPVSPVVAPPVMVVLVITPPPSTTVVVNTAPTAGGSVVDLAAQTVTNPTTGTPQPITNLGITDTAANLVIDPLVTSGTNVTVTDAATMAQLATIDGANGAGTLTYAAVSDTVANLNNNTGGYLTGAVNVTVSDTVAVAALASIEALTTGTVKAANLTDAVTNLAPGGVASIYIGSGSNVVLTDTASLSQATAIDTANGGGTLAFTAGITDAATSLVDAAGATPAAGVAALLAQAPNVTVTGAATIAQLAYINNTNGAGALTYTAVSDTAASLATNTGSYVATGKNITVTDVASLAQLAAIDGANGAGTLTYTAVSDTAASLTTNTGSYVATGKNVTVTDVATMAQ